MSQHYFDFSKIKILFSEIPRVLLFYNIFIMTEIDTNTEYDPAELLQEVDLSDVFARSCEVRDGVEEVLHPVGHCTTPPFSTDEEAHRLEWLR